MHYSTPYALQHLMQTRFRIDPFWRCDCWLEPDFCFNGALSLFLSVVCTLSLWEVPQLVHSDQCNFFLLLPMVWYFWQFYRQHASIHAFSHDLSWLELTCFSANCACTNSHDVAATQNLATSCFLLYDVSVFFWSVYIYSRIYSFFCVCLCLRHDLLSIQSTVDAHVCCWCIVWLWRRESQRVCVCTCVRTCPLIVRLLFPLSLSHSFSLSSSFLPVAIPFEYEQSDTHTIPVKTYQKSVGWVS